VDVSVSRVAKSKIRSRGGQLWIWTARIGGANDLIRTSFSCPEGIEFERLYVDDLILWFQRAFPIERVTIGWTPLTGIDVTWIGTPWVGGGN
jgi:hypothetical protein